METTTDIICKVFEGHNIRQYQEDGYYSATDMCKIFDKLFRTYYEIPETKEFLTATSKELNTPTSWLIEIHHVGVKVGIWVHPCIAAHLAAWLSPRLAEKVAEWTEEWKLASIKNTTQRKDMQNDRIDWREEKIEARDTLIETLISQGNYAFAKVNCPCGKVDILTGDKIIIVKEYNKWKDAIGGTLSCGYFYPHHKPCIYLFGDNDELTDIIITQVCAKLGIEWIR